jgi:hypothetical protein
MHKKVLGEKEILMAFRQKHDHDRILNVKISSKVSIHQRKRIK